MSGLLEERRLYLDQRKQETARSLQLAALQSSCGIDLSALLRSRPIEQRRAIRRIERFVERERLRGLFRHWTYDINRHISLVQALGVLNEIVSHRPLSPETKTAPDGAVIVESSLL